MEKTRKQLVATVAAMLGDQYKVSISTRHFEESLKEFDSTYFIEIVKKAAGDSLVPVIALDPFVKAVNQNEISMNRAASIIINTFFEAESEADKTDFSSCLSKKYILDHVFYQMFPSAACEHLPFAAPSKTFFDLTVLYMLDLDVTAFGGGMCVVSSAMMSELEITAAELDSAVRRNISDCDFKLQKPKPKTIQQNPILANSYIVSCEKHRNAVLLFSEYFQKLANYLQDDLYVLQLSIYHVLVVPAATFTACSVDEIAPILYSALRKFAPKATVLGTSIYKFDRTEGNFSTIIK